MLILKYWYQHAKWNNGEKPQNQKLWVSFKRHKIVFKNPSYPVIETKGKKMVLENIWENVPHISKLTTSPQKNENRVYIIVERKAH